MSLSIIYSYKNRAGGASLSARLGVCQVDWESLKWLTIVYNFRTQVLTCQHSSPKYDVQNCRVCRSCKCSMLFLHGYLESDRNWLISFLFYNRLFLLNWLSHHPSSFLCDINPKICSGLWQESLTLVTLRTGSRDLHVIRDTPLQLGPVTSRQRRIPSFTTRHTLTPDVVETKNTAIIYPLLNLQKI